MLGLHDYDNGKIIFDNIELNKIDEYDKMKLKSSIGTVFQGSALFDSMTIEENVMFPLKMFQDMEMEEMKTRVNEVLKES